LRKQSTQIYVTLEQRAGQVTHVYLAFMFGLGMAQAYV